MIFVFDYIVRVPKLSKNGRLNLPAGDCNLFIETKMQKYITKYIKHIAVSVFSFQHTSTNCINKR